MIDIENITTEQLKSNSHEAYKSIFMRWYTPLCNYAYSLLLNMDEAEDAVQKVFCKIWDQRMSITVRISIKSYLYRCVHNDCMNRIQQAKSRAEHNQHYMYSAAKTDENTSQLVTKSELEQQIEKSVYELPEQCRKVFEMSRKYELSYAEIAEKLNISTNTVENHISKALKILRVKLKDFLPVILLLLMLKLR